MNEDVLKVLKATNHQTVFHSLGIELVALDQNKTVVSLNVDDRHRQQFGLVHGGIYVLLAESAASVAAACTLTSFEESVVALEINANHLRTVQNGKLSAFATAIHLGKTTMVYETRVLDDKDQLVSVGRCTLVRVKKKSG